jgi:hypothetical protein
MESKPGVKEKALRWAANNLCIGYLPIVRTSYGILIICYP